MLGHPAVYCDGVKWNGTKPSCQAAASVPELTMDFNETKAGDLVRCVSLFSGALVISISVRFVCSSTGGNPGPIFSFLVNNTRVKPDYLDPLQHGNRAVLELEMTKEYHGVDVACTAENHLNPFPSASNHRMLSVNCKSSFANGLKYNFPLVGPSTVTINGSSSLHITRPGQIGPFSCFSDESHPPSELHVVITDDKENVLEPIITKHPKMKATHGFASMLEFSFKLETYAEEIKIQCTASNGESYLTTDRSISIQSMNQTYLQL